MTCVSAASLPRLCESSRGAVFCAFASLRLRCLAAILFLQRLSAGGGFDEPPFALLGSGPLLASHVCEQVFPHAREIPQAAASRFPPLAQAGGCDVTLSIEPVKVRPAQAEHFSRNLAVAKFR